MSDFKLHITPPSEAFEKLPDEAKDALRWYTADRRGRGQGQLSLDGLESWIHEDCNALAEQPAQVGEILRNYKAQVKQGHTADVLEPKATHAEEATAREGRIIIR